MRAESAATVKIVQHSCAVSGATMFARHSETHVRVPLGIVVNQLGAGLAQPDSIFNRPPLFRSHGRVISCPTFTSSFDVGSNADVQRFLRIRLRAGGELGTVRIRAVHADSMRQRQLGSVGEIVAFREGSHCGNRSSDGDIGEG